MSEVGTHIGECLFMRSMLRQKINVENNSRKTRESGNTSSGFLPQFHSNIKSTMFSIHANGIK